MLKESDSKQLVATHSKLKKGSRDISKEVGAYLFDNYHCFLRSKDSLTALHH
jgi:hypothetical protein